MKTANLYSRLNASYIDYSSATVVQQKEHVTVTISTSSTDLTRNVKLKSCLQFDFDAEKKQVHRLPLVPGPNPSILVANTSPSGSKVVRFRSGEKDDKELFLEVWSETRFESSLKIHPQCSKVYNDGLFGTIMWNKSETKLVFIGEIPAGKSYHNYFAPKSDDEQDSATTTDSKTFEHQQSFGETLEGKVNPGIFLYDLETKKLSRVKYEAEEKDVSIYPQRPMFDEANRILFQGIKLQSKLGLNYCLNRPTSLYIIEDTRLVRLTPDIYLAFNAVFTDDFKKLVFFGKRDMFVEHSTNFQLFVVDWLGTKEISTLIDTFPAYPEPSATFWGLYGYQVTFHQVGFIGSSNYFVFQSQIQGRTRIYAVNTDTKQVEFLSPLQEKDAGEYSLMKIYRNFCVLKYSNYDKPPKVVLVEFSSSEKLEYSSYVLDQIVFKDSEVSSMIASLKQETIALENGAQGYFIYRSNEKNQPLVLLVHGGPFSASPRDAFLLNRAMLLLQGFNLLVVNYRGSIGFGETFLTSLLGQIGTFDIADCGELTRMCLEKYSQYVDADRVAVYGGSHGGFITGHLSGNPQYKSLFKAAIVWNGVLHLPFNLTATDIPDWVFACAQKSQLSFAYDSELNKKLFQMSPLAFAHNVTCPSLLLVGLSDLRVPPHQSLYYFNVLKENGTPVKMFTYQDSGHGIAKVCEQSVDANMQIFLFLNEHLL